MLPHPVNGLETERGIRVTFAAVLSSHIGASRHFTIMTGRHPPRRDVRDPDLITSEPLQRNSNHLLWVDLHQPSTDDLIISRV